MDIEIFKKQFFGFNIVDCAVRRRDFYYFVAREDYTQHPDWNEGDEAPNETNLKKRVISFIGNKPLKEQWSSATITGFKQVVGGVSFSPIEQFVLMSLTGQVYAVGSGSAGVEQAIPYSPTQRRSTIFNLKTIGAHLYAAGWDRTLGIREGKERWNWLSANIPFNETLEENKCGFRDIDGSSQQDIHGVGDNGDIWKFDGSLWTRLSFPSNITLNTVCRSPDGVTYVSGYEGETYVGNGDSWKQLAKPNLSLPFKDMVWYQDRVWCTNDYGVWWIKDGQLLPAEISADVKVCAGNLSTRDGVLLLAGYFGAAALADGEWKIIFHHNTLTEKVGGAK